MITMISGIINCILLYAIFDFIWYKAGYKTPGINAEYEFKTWWFWKYQCIRLITVTILYIIICHICR